MNRKKNGIAIRTDKGRDGGERTCDKISNTYWVSNHWRVDGDRIHEGDEIALFKNKEKADSFMVGEIVAILDDFGISDDGTKQPRKTFIFKEKANKVVRRSVFKSDPGHEYYCPDD